MTQMAEAARDPSMIAREINFIKEQAKTYVLGAAVEIGKRLYEAKGIVPHGQWGEWLTAHVDYSERTAQNLMRLFEEYGKKQNPQALADLSYTKAVALLGLTGEEREEFTQTHDVEGMSLRDLQEEIAAIREERDARQVTIDQMLGERKAAEKKLTAAEKEAKKAKDQLVAARKDAEKERARADQAEEKLEAQPEPEVQVVERVPDEVQTELNHLRRVASAAPNETVIRFRAAYERLKGEFEAVIGLLIELDSAMPEEAGKYRQAVRAAAERMAEIAGKGNA